MELYFGEGVQWWRWWTLPIRSWLEDSEGEGTLMPVYIYGLWKYEGTFSWNSQL